MYFENPSQLPVVTGSFFLMGYMHGVRCERSGEGTAKAAPKHGATCCDMLQHVNKFMANRQARRKSRPMPTPKKEKKIETKMDDSLFERFNTACKRRSAQPAVISRQLIEAFCEAAGDGMGPAAPFEIRAKPETK